MTDKLKAAREFISYSANAEDVLLRRLFPGPEFGFYVDVGAGHPIWENDTKALHDRGWRGINIEPQEHFLAELRRERPDDVNLGVALSNAPGELAFFDVENTSLSTLDEHNAARAKAAGHRVKSRTVGVLTLAQVLVENNAPSAFGFLKIDVEGLEQAVLAGNDWLSFRPHVVMIEATLPETPIRRQDGCRAFLTGVGWRHAWFDGLNDWYLAPDFDPPDGAFDAPPNIFDRYVTRRTVEAEAAVRSLEVDNARLRARVADVNADLAKHNKALSIVQDDLVSTRQEIAAVRAESKHFQEVMQQAQAQSKHKKVLSHVQNDLVLTRQEVTAPRAESNKALSHVRNDRLLAENNYFGEVLQQAQMRSERLQVELNAIRASTSWRLSAPVRALGRILKRR